MTFPSTFNSVNRIIEYAMKDAGLLQQGDAPDSDQLAEYSNRLNDLINLWQTQGLKLWVQRDLSVPLVAGQATYTFRSLDSNPNTSAKPLRVLQAYNNDSSNIHRPLTPLSRDEYARLSVTTQLGAINSYFVDKQTNILSVSLWLVPDTVAASGTLHLILQYPIVNPTNLLEAVEFPQEWFMALRWGLADDICTGQPDSIMSRCAQRALAFRNALEDWDVEDASTHFSPDTRSQVGTWGFR